MEKPTEAQIVAANGVILQALLAFLASPAGQALMSALIAALIGKINPPAPPAT